ncbi:MAG: hypothetical protein M1490_01100 [Candidatus Bathyarchaeota archaeon]|nr:hypothetical protein [Candidatus Bathyarchaeota archaeon]
MKKHELKERKFKSKYYHMITGRDAKAYCSIFFIHTLKDDKLELLMFRTKSKQGVAELEKKIHSFIIPRLKEIVFALDGHPFEEWLQHISYEGHYYHYE